MPGLAVFRKLELAYCAENWPSTSEHAGDSEADCVARHSMMRPPPGGTPAHSVRTSPPQAERNTNRISRGRIGRSTSAGAGAAAGAATVSALAAAAGAPAAGAAPPPTALTAFSQLPETFALFF